MATFHIHEDKENYHSLAGRSKKINGEQDKKIVAKKYSVGNRGVLKTLNNGIKQEAKRVKLSEECDKNTKEVKVKNVEKKSYPVAEDSGFGSAFFTTSTEQNNISRWKNEKEKDVFPRCLMFNTEYRNDIWRYLRESESQHPTLKSTYMLKQPDLNWNTRSILIDWLSSVAVEYKFCNETFHLGVNYIDRFLSQIAVVRNKFQLVGASAMMVAGKIEEYQAIDAQEWSYLTGDTFSAHKILKMEQLIMKMLKFRMQPPTIYTFIRHLSSEMQMEPKIVHLAMYISELALLEGDDYLNQFPSKLAAASIALARYTFSKQKPWPEKLKEVSGYSLKELSPVVQRQQKTFRDSPSKGQQAIQTKYKSEKYNRVALLKPRALNLNDFDDDEE